MHPELRTMTAAFIVATIAEKPDDIDCFAEKFFTDPDLAHTVGCLGWSRPETPECDLVDEHEVLLLVSRRKKCEARTQFL